MDVPYLSTGEARAAAVLAANAALAHVLADRTRDSPPSTCLLAGPVLRGSSVRPFHQAMIGTPASVAGLTDSPSRLVRR